MQYPGEHLLPGQIGHFFAVLSFVASIVATVAYFKSARSSVLIEQLSWKRMARVAFGVNTASVIVIFCLLLFLISNHYFEYYYVWNHSNMTMDMKYLFSCIWEGQEGGFLLWGLWQGLLGMILMRSAKTWEAPVMTVVSFAQFTIASMLLGIYIFGVKVGLNPFILVRQQFIDQPAFQNLSSTYMSHPSMKDGQGLNQLLQNYWMVIHPPVLFLGFASTLIPFAYAVAAIWQRRYTEWTKPVLPWALFSAAILGLGIMMGAAWAYESLTFGGYWAWDPVENASLVPWLILIAGLHTNLIYNSTGYSQRTTVLFYILTYIFVIYSSFLTKSGILGDSSVHAFATAGLNTQMTIWLAVIIVPSIWLYINRYKQIPTIVKEESTYSREFWMFIGSLIFFLSAMYVSIATSLPVVNKLFGTKFAVGEDVEFSYNRIQVWVAILTGILTAITQFFRYKDSDRKKVNKSILLPGIIALAATILVGVFGPIEYYKYGAGFLSAIYIALFAGFYALFGNAIYIWQGLNGKLKAAGGSVAHIGFGMMLVGILISASKKEVLSLNTTGINLPFSPESKENPLENLTLIQGVKTDMGRFNATYTSDSLNKKGNITYFKIEFERKDGKENFVLFPNLIRNTKGAEGFSNNPDSRHYWNKDVFSYISYADDLDRKKDTASFRPHELAPKDTVFYSNGFMVLGEVDHNPSDEKFSYTSNDTALVANLKVTVKDGRTYNARPALEVKNGMMVQKPDTVFAQNLIVNFNKIGEDNKKIEIGVKESSSILPYVSLKVYLFPYINVLWLGIIVMMIGFVMSIVRRVKMMRPRLNVVR